MARKKIILIFFIFLFTIFFQIKVQAKIWSECPTDNTYITENTVFSGDFCNIEDSTKRKPGEEGAIIIKASNIILDCNGTTLNGTGFNETLDRPNFRFGIFNMGYENVTIKNCIVQNFFDGILSVKANNSKVFNNVVKGCQNGIVLDGVLHYQEKWERTEEHIPTPTNMKIFNNTLISNSQNINLLYADNNEIFNNNASLGVHGIQTENSSNNKIFNNIFMANDGGIYLWDNSDDNGVFDNKIISNKVGILSENSRNNIFNNIFLKNKEDRVIKDFYRSSEKGIKKESENVGEESPKVDYVLVILLIVMTTLIVILIINYFSARKCQ